MLTVTSSKPNPPSSQTIIWLLSLLCFAITPAAIADNGISSIKILSRLDYNAIVITEVDLVFVYDQQLAEQLPTLKGEWYSQKYDLLKNDQSGMEVITISIPQGFDSQDVILPDQSTKAVRVFAAGYHDAQDMPVSDLTRWTRVLIEIDAFGILVSEPPQ
ncbi:MAG: hypothetical protein JKY98_01780 [Gammaproteobacteria bacterium]|nr:hypothetical protein [Gammaproteobacteria bacterium]